MTEYQIEMPIGQDIRIVEGDQYTIHAYQEYVNKNLEKGCNE